MPIVQETTRLVVQMPSSFHACVEQKIDRRQRADQDQHIVVRQRLKLVLDLDFDLIVANYLDVRLKQHLQLAFGHRRFERLPIIEFEPKKFVTAIRERHAVVVHQHERGFDGRVAAPDDQHVMVMIVFGRVKPINNLVRFVFARDF